MSAGVDVFGEIDVHVVTTRQEGGHHDGRTIEHSGGAEDLGGGGAQHVEERDVHGLPQRLRYLRGKVTDHLQALRLTRAMGYQHEVHRTTASGARWSSTSSSSARR